MPSRAEMSEAQLEFLTGLIRRESLPGSHLEIGTAYGGTLARMILARPAASPPVFVSVDNMAYVPDQPTVIARTLSGHGIDPANVEFRVGDSGECFRDALRAGDSFDFILIDASHRIHRVMGDLRWTRLLRPGGVVCLHDYGPSFPGVIRAVDRFLDRHPPYERIGQEGTLLALRKTAPCPQPEVSWTDRAWAYGLHLRSKLGR